MAQARFKVIFDKVEELESTEFQGNDNTKISGISSAELEEISELRRIVLETSDQEPILYTLT